jgi:hypothetical protein
MRKEEEEERRRKKNSEVQTKLIEREVEGA